MEELEIYVTFRNGKKILPLFKHMYVFLCDIDYYIHWEDNFGKLQKNSHIAKKDGSFKKPGAL